MRTLAIVLLVAGLAWTLKGKVEMLEASPVLSQDTVPASAIQAILKDVVRQKPNLYPLDTVFVRPEGSMIVGRFLFMDRTNYSGIQYDVRAELLGDQQVRVTEMQATVNPNLVGPFKPYGKANYINYKDVTGGLDAEIFDVKNMMGTV
jgi:hypothetical protein